MLALGLVVRRRISKVRTEVACIDEDGGDQTILQSLNLDMPPHCQVVELMQHFPGESEALPPEAGEGSGGLEGERSYREEAFIAVFSNITDESNLDL